MARLMVVPIRNRGDSVLIITRHADVELIGFVARTTLRGLLKDNPSMCDCVSFVERSLPMMERILARKSLQDASGEGETPCIEITAADLRHDHDLGNACLE
jgi:hypothetical protein